MKTDNNFSRRKFIKSITSIGLMLIAAPKNIFSKLFSAQSRVVIVSDSTATSGTTINSNTVQIMIDAGIKGLTGIDDTGEAWKTIFPGITATSRIAIKVNCINSALSSHPQVATAVCNSIGKMNFAGTFFPANNLIIFDRTNSELTAAKYTKNTGTTGVRCFGTDQSGIGYATQTYSVSGVNEKVSKIVTDMCDYLVNLAVLKNHSGGGVTLSLKNHYGTCNDPGSLHNTNCDPYIPALNALAPIKNKQKICIIDSLYGIRSGGPGGSPQFVANKFIMSVDPVATDYYGRKLLKDNGCTTTGTATHIDTAATVYGLGTNNPANIELIEINNPTAKSISVVFPNGGEVLQGGSTQKIKWQSANINNIKIEYTLNGGKTWTELSGSVPAGSPSEYNWIVPDETSSQCKIRIADSSDANVKDESNNNFSILAKPSVTLSAPNGGEELVTGNIFQIKWQNKTVEYVNLEYSTDNGNNWTPIVVNLAADMKMYNWPVPAVQSPQCLIKIKDSSDGQVFDLSDAPFSIVLVSSVKENININKSELKQNYPNPFNSSTRINFSLKNDSDVLLEVSDAQGKVVDVIAKQFFRAGEQEIIYNSKSLSSGVYYLNLKTGSTSLIKKMLLIK